MTTFSAVFLALLVVLSMASAQTKQSTIEPLEKFLGRDPATLKYNQFREYFEQDSSVVIKAIEELNKEPRGSFRWMNSVAMIGAAGQALDSGHLAIALESRELSSGQARILLQSLAWILHRTQDGAITAYLTNATNPDWWQSRLPGCDSVELARESIHALGLSGDSRAGQHLWNMQSGKLPDELKKSAKEAFGVYAQVFRLGLSEYSK